MKNKKTVLILAAVFLVLLVGAYMLYDRLAPEQLADQPAATTAPSQQEITKIKAPDFTVYDLQGNPVRLSDFYGKKPVILNFWASWCGPCKMEMPDFQEKYLEWGEEVQFLMVNVTGGRETLENASAFIRQQGYDFPVFYDTAGEAATAYAVYSLPSTYFIDIEGNCIARAIGAINGETLQRRIDMIR